jgi:hypothetical protein
MAVDYSCICLSILETFLTAAAAMLLLLLLSCCCTCPAVSVLLM